MLSICERLSRFITGKPLSGYDAGYGGPLMRHRGAAKGRNG